MRYDELSAFLSELTPESKSKSYRWFLKDALAIMHPLEFGPFQDCFYLHSGVYSDTDVSAQRFLLSPERVGISIWYRAFARQLSHQNDKRSSLATYSLSWESYVDFLTVIVLDNSKGGNHEVWK